MIEVVEPGVLTTVQDAGRPGWQHLGVPAGGAADPWSLAVANTLAGNGDGAAALEVTLAGLRLRALEDIFLAVAGADMAATARGRSLGPGRATRLAAGEELALAGPIQGTGIRACVAVAGGIDVPVVLGSRSTCLAGSFGGHEGRPLRAGDVLRVGPAAGPGADAWPGDPMAPRGADPDGTLVFRIVPGHTADPGGITQTRWRVTPASDRMGVRLSEDAGTEQPSARSRTRARAGVDSGPSHGVVRGTIQVPSGGEPIVLGADHQPTGGYPVAGVVIAADMAALGQVAPGDRVRFEVVDHERARAALRERRAAWRDAVRVLRADAGWDDLWRSAGA